MGRACSTVRDGPAMVWSAAGEAGVARAIEILKKRRGRTLKLLGVRPSAR